MQPIVAPCLVEASGLAFHSSLQHKALEKIHSSRQGKLLWNANPEASTKHGATMGCIMTVQETTEHCPIHILGNKVGIKNARCVMMNSVVLEHILGVTV